ncbi:phosphoribosylformylglycinamidine synthase I [Candidatus Marinamargulisbacteria bacterium SCGC AG-343-D04]|nr:phosphoribosylformylglycinamidine synthase I [Candidatus Marinamargulisbacteria bacterium SCGC AG-343-D04]
MTSIDVAIIQFPGSNCEYETQECVESVGLSSDIVSWNSSKEHLSTYASFILPGGFSFQDRVRAGVVSSKLPILNHLKSFSKEGRPILGICNGCQILAESGLVPDTQGSELLEMALAPNMKESSSFGFICDWVYVKIKGSGQSVFTKRFDDDDVLPIPVNHGEGNFKFKDSEFIAKNHVSVMHYCTEDGDVDTRFPVNPNGSDLNIAGLSNSKGNVFAMMPHPERASFWYQLPRYLHDDFSRSRRNLSLKEGPWIKLFESLKDYIREGQL